MLLKSQAKGKDFSISDVGKKSLLDNIKKKHGT